MRSFPWDSLVVSMGDDGFPIYDRDYRASDLQEVYQTFFSNGVFLHTPDAFQVTAGEGMNVLVATGKCCINGTVGYESSARTLALQASSSQDRIDTIVLRWNADVETRSIDLYVKTGTAAATPTAPALTRSETVYELGLADIFVTKNSGAISSARITDTRLTTARCGIVTPLVNINTESLYQTLNAALQELENNLEEQTQRAVDLAQNALDGTVAGNLQSQIDDLDDGKVSKSGDTMHGRLTVDLNTDTPFLAKRTIGDNLYAARIGVHNNGMAIVTAIKDDVATNQMLLYEDKTAFWKPVNVESGGTGANNAADARVNLGALHGVYGGPNNVYVGMGYPSGNTASWIRTTNDGLLPYTSGGASSLGSSGWPFNNAYIKNIYPLNSASAMADYIVASSTGANGTNSWTKWFKFYSGLAIVYIYGYATGSTTSTSINVKYPFTINDPFIGGAVVSQSGNADIYTKSVARNADNTSLGMYAGNSWSGSTVTYSVSIIGSWK